MLTGRWRKDANGHTYRMLHKRGAWAVEVHNGPTSPFFASRSRAAAWLDELRVEAPQRFMHVVCYSGGHSSAVVAIEVARRFPDDRVVLLNHNINPQVESADIKRFKREVAAHLGIPITYANHANWDAKDQFDICTESGAFKVGVSNVICTSRLKTEPFKEWLVSNAAPETTIVYYGFDADEKVRIQRRSSIMGSMGYRTDYPLALWSEEQRTIQSTSEVGISPPLTYSVFKHANCIGCIKAGRQHWYVVYCLRRDLWEKAKRAEDQIGYSILRNIYLEELEPEFQKMLDRGILPTEKIHANTFWAEVRRKLKSSIQDDEIETDAKPCECVV